jgi:cytochrome c-type biogenesis protein CcmH/NrfG
MANGKTNAFRDGTGWTSTQACVMAAICLLIGGAVGYFLAGSAGFERPPAAATGAAPGGNTSSKPAMASMGQQPTPQQLKQMADTQAAPLIERLKTEPKNAALLADIGNLYYDARQFPLAIDYYQRSLKVQPGNTNVRVDLGTAMWYLGNPDKAIEQYKTVLKAEPTKPNALMNLGVVEWQGKMNVPAAVVAWEKLLATNPNFEGKQQVQQLIAQAKKHSNLQLGAKTTKPPM